ncbi:MAG: hypothetical protein EXR86_04260 [Gammaproteobacteria bacterium]|nr:hypothetical protein [Gammaproteobacteria bacterium]
MNATMISRTAVRRMLLGGMAVAIVFVTADARQFRYLQPIATPSTRSAALPAGATPVEPIVALSRDQVEPALTRVIESWNSQALGEQLGDGFYDKSRLLDAIDTTAPRDASLRLQSIQGVQTLQQYLEPDPVTEGSTRLVSRVSVTARTQLEFTAGDGSFTRRPGVNEFILRITHPEQ